MAKTPPATQGFRVFAEDERWVVLARARKLRLPRHDRPCGRGQMARYLHKLGVSASQYLAWTGEKTLADFAAANPDWGLRAWVGLVLEWLAETRPVEGAKKRISDTRKRPDPGVIAGTDLGATRG